ncbi:MAG: ribulose-phosphate 3-epimerase [Elusimicrobiota bacterium]
MKISVSILNLDFRKLEKEMNRIEKGKPNSFHMDIMDGHLVDNISFGPDIVKTVRRITELPIHSHLMITNPEKFTDRFFESGSSTVTIHAEALTRENKSLLKKNNLGLSLNPDYPVEKIYPYLDKVKRVLIMSVYAGFGGQSFIEESLERINKIAEKRKKRGLDFKISVDGGINVDTALLCKQAGADEVSVGSYITRSDNPAGRIKAIKKL